MAEHRNELRKIIKSQRVMSGLTLHELARASGVSPSHLGRIERGERFPSARILGKLAKPLGFSEGQLFAFAGYLPSEKAKGEAELDRLDPYAARVLSEEPVEIQRAVIGILSILKSMVKAADYDIEFAEYAHRKYPKLGEDVITMIQDMIEQEQG